MQIIKYLLIGSLATLFIPLFGYWFNIPNWVYFNINKTIGDYMYYPFWYGGIILMAWVAAPRFSLILLTLLAWGWAAGELFIFDMCQWHLDWKLGMPMGEPFFSWFTVESIAHNGIYNFAALLVFRLLYLWRRKRKATTHDPGANPKTG